MDTAALVEKWRRILGLRGWKLRLQNEPPPGPGRNAAFNEYEFAAREARIWASDEQDVVHEELHLVLAPLEDAFWKTDADKSLRALWKRREEQTVLRLERAFLKVLKR